MNRKTTNKKAGRTKETKWDAEADFIHVHKEMSNCDAGKDEKLKSQS